MTWLILTIAAAPDRVSAEAAAPLISDTLKVTLAAPDGGTVDEGETGHFEVSVAGSTAAGAVKVRYSISGTAVAGVDYVALSGEVTVPQGESGVRIALAALNDGILDKGETVVLALTGATGPGTVLVDQTAATATIADNGTVAISLTAVPDTISEGSEWRSAVTMSTPVAGRVSVRWWTTDGTAVAGRDYTAADEVVSFKPGETSKPISVQTLEDDNAEAVEVFYVSLDLPFDAARSGTGGGIEVDPKPQSAFIECSVAFPDDVQTMFKLNETAPSGTVVGTVAAETHSIPFYSITGGQNKFAINSLTGEISTTGTLNRSSFHITVSVSDDCGGSDSVHVTIKVNRTPEADAGVDKTVTGGDPVELDGTGSTDPDGDDLTFSWTGGLTLADPNTATPSFTAPDVDKTTRYKFTLTVTDLGNLSDSDDVTITVEPNDEPDVEAKASPNPARAGTKVSLLGKATDPQNDKMTYQWTQLPGGPQVSISGSATLSASFTAPLVENSTVLTFRLTATDARGAIGSAEVPVIVEPNGAPDVTATASPNPARVGTEVSLTGTADDPEDDAMKYQWTQLPGGPRVTIRDATTLAASFTVPRVTSVTDLTFRLTATDSFEATGSADIPVTVKPNGRPMVTVTASPTPAREGTKVSLTGTAKDPEDDAMTYQWTQLPGGPRVTIRDATTLAASFTAPRVTSVTDLTFRLTATDSLGATGSADGTVTLKPNAPPDVTAKASPNPVEERKTASLTGTATDPDSDRMTYLWTQLPGNPRVTIRNATTLNASFAAPSVEQDTELAFRLKATDALGASNSADVTVTVENRNKPPDADAGIDKWVYEGERVTLDGSDSKDEDGRIVEWAWTGPVSITNANRAKASFTAPDVTAATDHEFVLRVKDNDGATDRDTVVVTVEPDTTTTCTALVAKRGHGSGEARAAAGYARRVAEQGRVELRVETGGRPDRDFVGRGHGFALVRHAAGACGRGADVPVDGDERVRFQHGHRRRAGDGS